MRRDRTDRAGGCAGRAKRRAEIHGGLGEIPGPIARREIRGEPPDRRSCGGQRLLHRKQARHDPFDIGVDDRRREAERDRGDRRRRVIANAGQQPQGSFARRERSAVVLDDGLGASMQVAGPGVIAKPGPLPKQVLARRGGELLDRWPNARNRA